MMPKDRYIGIDTGKGFAIFIMVTFHMLFHQIGQRQTAIVTEIIESATIFELFFIVPIALLGIMGTGFHFFNAISITVQMSRLANQAPKKLSGSVKRRIITNLLFIILNRITYEILGERYFRDRYFYFPIIRIRFVADAVDTIAFSAIILSFILYGLYSFKSLRNPKCTFWIFFIFTIGWLTLSNQFIVWGQQTISKLHGENFYILEFIVSKFTIGRFKLFQILGFTFLGVCVACLVIMDITKLQLLWCTFILNFITIGTVFLWIYLDSSFLQNITGEDVPLPLQIFSLGAETIIIVYFLIQYDYSPSEKQVRVAKRTLFFRRYGVISLTIYSIHEFVNKQIFHIISLIWGSAIQFSETKPVLAWNWVQVFVTILITILCWECILQLWEKFDFKYSLEWLLSRVLMKNIEFNQNGQKFFQKIINTSNEKKI